MKNLIFLCLGDSLTAGFPGYQPSLDGISEGFGEENSQYEFWLKVLCIELLENKLGSVGDDLFNGLMFVNKGVPGEITGEFLKRIDEDMIKFVPKPNYSIILGGSNDLGWNVSNNEILKNIEKLHQVSREHDIISIGGTIPPMRDEHIDEDYHHRKIRVNDQLREYFRANNIPFADLYNGMCNEEGNLNHDYGYVDGLHFTISGYRQMGTVIFNEVVKAIFEKTYL